MLVPDLKAISDICGPATWTHATLDVATTTPNGAPTTPATPAATYPWVSAAQWDAVSRNPDSHAGETYTISGTVSEYNWRQQQHVRLGREYGQGACKVGDCLSV